MAVHDGSSELLVYLSPCKLLASVARYLRYLSSIVELKCILNLPLCSSDYKQTTMGLSDETKGQIQAVLEKCVNTLWGTVDVLTTTLSTKSTTAEQQRRMTQFLQYRIGHPEILLSQKSDFFILNDHIVNILPMSFIFLSLF